MVLFCNISIITVNAFGLIICSIYTRKGSVYFYLRIDLEVNLHLSYYRNVRAKARKGKCQ